jgi:uncharacterized membrane protein YeaQ/YmgE (transglycosylase-associated protein family)
MDLEQAVVLVVVGAVAGWLAGLVLKGKRMSLVGNIVVGVLGAIVGGWLFDVLGLSVGGEWVGPIVTAFAGAVLLLFVIGKLKK